LNNIETLYNHLEQLKSISGKLDKENYLKQIGDPLTKEVLRFLNDSRITTGIASKKLNKSLDCSMLQTIDFTNVPFENVLNFLETNNTGQDSYIASIQKYIATFDDKYKEMLQKIVTKSLKLGVSAKTLNKAYGDGFIPEFNLQLAHSYEKYKHRLVNGKEEFGLTIKYDGHRTATETNTQRLYSRTGKLILGVIDIESEMKTLDTVLQSILGHTYEPYMIDGELLIQSSTAPKTQWFNQTSEILSKNGVKTNISYKIFDIISQDEFYNQKESHNNFKERRELLDAIFTQHQFKYLELAPLLYFGTDVNQIDTYYQDAIENDEEGIMINLNKPYQCKRTPYILKVKPTLSADLEIIGFEKGEPYSKYENTLGNLIVNFNGVAIGVGSGLSDKMRDEIWNNQDDYLHKIAEIQYTSISKNKNNDDLNLRFPRFKTIRNDKTIDDINIEY